MKENKSIKQLNAREGGYYYAFTMALYIVISFLGQAITGAIVNKASTAYIAVCSTFSAITFLAVLSYAVFIKKMPYQALTGEKLNVKFLPVALLLSCGMFLGLGYVNDAIAGVLIGWGANVTGIVVPLQTPIKFIIFSITFALLPAIAEELFFRGILLNSLSGVKRIYAVLISALCFALYHCSVVQLVYQFIYGVGLGFLYVCAKNVFPCIVAHFVNNFTVLCLQYFRATINLVSTHIIIIGALCLAVFATIVFLVLRKREKEQEVKGELKRFFFPAAIFAVVVCVALAIGNIVG